jgi:hypothetical protein
MEPRFNAGMDWISPQRSLTLLKGGILSSGATRSCATGEARSTRRARRARHASVTGWESGESSIRDLARFKACRASSRLSIEGKSRNLRYARTRCCALCQFLSESGWLRFIENSSGLIGVAPCFRQGIVAKLEESPQFHHRPSDGR